MTNIFYIGLKFIQRKWFMALMIFYFALWLVFNFLTYPLFFEIYNVDLIFVLMGFVLIPFFLVTSVIGVRASENIVHTFIHTGFILFCCLAIYYYISNRFWVVFFQPDWFSSTVVHFFDEQKATTQRIQGMHIPRSLHTAFKLPNGDVLISSGTYYSYKESAEIFDHQSQTFKLVSDPDIIEKWPISASFTLPNHKVLFIGDNIIEYDPKSQQFDRQFNLSAYFKKIPYTWSEDYLKVLLDDGKLLFIVSDGPFYNNKGDIQFPFKNFYKILYNTQSHTISSIEKFHSQPTPEQSQLLKYGKKTVLSNGQVLLTNGNTPTPTFKTYVFDPKAERFIHTQPMHIPRKYYRTVVLPDGRVMVVGGDPYKSRKITFEIFDPTSNAFSKPKLIAQGYSGGYTATVLKSGKVLIAGYRDVRVAGKGRTKSEQKTIETQSLLMEIDPITERVADLGSLHKPKAEHTATLLDNGQVLLLGGINIENNCARLYTFRKYGKMYNPGEDPLNTIAELYTPNEGRK